MIPLPTYDRLEIGLEYTWKRAGKEAWDTSRRARMELAWLTFLKLTYSSHDLEWHGRLLAQRRRLDETSRCWRVLKSTTSLAKLAKLAKSTPRCGRP